MNTGSTHTKESLSQVREAILAFLSGLRCVTGIGTFGSFAGDSWDEWSDIDLIVECMEPERDAVLIIANLHARLPIQCHRPFTSHSGPWGRYWFKGYSPFHKLDVSFTDASRWQQDVDRLLCFGGNVKRIDCAAISPLGSAPEFIWDYTPHQKALFDILHRVHRYSRAFARSGESRGALANELNSMAQFMVSHPPSTTCEEQAWRVAEEMASLSVALLQ